MFNFDIMESPKKSPVKKYHFPWSLVSKRYAPTVKKKVQICSDITPCRLPNRLWKNTQNKATQKATFFDVILVVIPYVNKAVSATSKVPNNRIAIKLLPNILMMTAKNKNVIGGFKSHNLV